MTNFVPITVAIPTYRRESVLIDTLHYLMGLESVAAEIVVIDQTETHQRETELQLQAFADSGQVRWLRLARPSIPHAMNQGLLAATQGVVLFIDDDVRPEPELLTAHLAAHNAHPDVLVAGRVIQPWQEGKDFSADPAFHFAVTRADWVGEFIGCNFSVRRDTALTLGGFDENFVRVAYRYEAEFSHRLLASGRRIYFEPAACLHHLKDADGGTRTFGEHLTTWRPDHAVGAYYYSLCTGLLAEFVRRPYCSVATRYHLRRPWQIPATLLAELRGMVWAWRLHHAGPRYLNQAVGKGAHD